MSLLKNSIQTVLFVCFCAIGVAQETELKGLNKLGQFVEHRLYTDVGIIPISIVLESNNQFNIMGFNADVGYKFSEKFSVFMSFAPAMLLDKPNSKYSHLDNSGLGITYSFFTNDLKERKFKGLSTEIKGGVGSQY